ncbi:MAG: hypothetical protein WC829_02960 [Hyphomicrobium sp.]|jgi:hypothetical protein
MSRKRCVRKVWALVNPISHAIEGCAITSQKDLDKLLARELSSLDAFTTGKARMNEWSDMVNVNNLTQTLAGMGVGYEAMPDAHKAEQGLIEAAARFQRTGKMGLSGPAIQALRDVIEWHSLQRSSIPRSQYEEAIRLTGARIKSGHATIDLGKMLETT